MRLRHLLLVGAGLLVAASGAAQSDSNIRDQIASMEYRQYSFSPRWYYYNRYWGTVLDMPSPIPDIKGYLPGAGLHDSQGWVYPSELVAVPFYNFWGDNYVNERWRLMTPLRTVAAAEALLQKGRVQGERDWWQKIQIKDAVSYLDKSTDLPVVGAVGVTRDEREELAQTILDAVFKLTENGNTRYESLVELILGEYDAIQEEVSAISGSFTDNARKLRNLQDCNHRLRALSEKVGRVIAVDEFMRTYVDVR